MSDVQLTIGNDMNLVSHADVVKAQPALGDGHGDAGTIRPWRSYVPQFAALTEHLIIQIIAAERSV